MEKYCVWGNCWGYIFKDDDITILILKTFNSVYKLDLFKSWGRKTIYWFSLLCVYFLWLKITLCASIVYGVVWLLFIEPSPILNIFWFPIRLLTCNILLGKLTPCPNGHGNDYICTHINDFKIVSDDPEIYFNNIAKVIFVKSHGPQSYYLGKNFTYHDEHDIWT